jgi:seryl-tRNA synthetase
VQPKEVPCKLAGFSTCFRKEAGSHGRDTLGIFRVHQFEKVEQFVICDPEDSGAEHDKLLNVLKEFMKSLGLPYIVVNIVSGELNNTAAKKYDLEAWFPSYNAYRELVSCSNCLEFQSRAIGCHMGKDPATKKTKHVHMLNATLSATTRTLCCIIENYQTADGVTIPDVLVPYMGGLTFIPWKVDGQSNILPPTVAAAAPPAPTGGDEVSFCQSLFLSALDGYYVPHLCAVPPPYTFPNVTSS